jgi:hypothetical protein
MTVITIANMWWGSDESLERMIERRWPVESKADLLIACWFVGTKGTKLWRARWGSWAKSIYRYIWDGEYEHVQLPPRKKERDETAPS